MTSDRREEEQRNWNLNDVNGNDGELLEPFGQLVKVPCKTSGDALKINSKIRIHGKLKV
jgi:hypothetical protein